MPTTLLVNERASEEAVLAPSIAPVAPTNGRPRRTLPALTMAGGLVFLLLAGIVLTQYGTGSRPAPTPAPAAAGADPLAITMSARDVSVVTQVYEPGASSGWHTHPGIHAVAVLSGTLTVYDGQCQRQSYEPGRPYVGGQQSHLVRNEGEAPVTMVVTYLTPSAPTSTTTHAPAPAGCIAG